MAFDDERGRTGNFSASLLTPTSHPGGQGGGGTNWGPAYPPQFLGGSEAGNFLSGGGDNFTNFSQYLMANPGGAGQPDSTARTGGQAGLDSAMNNAYGVHVYGDPNAGTAAAQPPPDPALTPTPTSSPPPPNVTPGGSGGQQYGTGGVNTGGVGAPGDDRHHNLF